MGQAARRAALVALLSPVLLIVVWAFQPHASYGIAMTVHALTLVAAGFAMSRAARTGDGRLRRARRWMTGALAASGAGFLVAAVEAAVRGRVPTVGFANLTPLIWVPCALTGLLAVPSQEHRQGGRLRALLDGVVVAAALALGSWIVFLQPTWETGTRTGFERAVLMTYPINDLLVGIAAFATAAHARADMRRFLHAAVGGLLLAAVADSGTALAVARGQEGFEWHNVVLQAGLALLLLAALMPTTSGATDDNVVAVTVDAALPHLPVGLAGAVVVVHLATGHALDASSVLLGSLALAGVVARQTLYARHLVAMARRLSVEATRDPLTDLHNRRACLRELEGALAERRPGEVALVLIDLDGFKEVNDSFGHAAGDDVLRAVADRLRSIVDATPARLGGDEFALVVTGPHAELRAHRAAELAASAQGTSAGALTVRVHASAGLATSVADDTTSALLRRADLALYEAKRGRGRGVVVFAENLAEQAERRHLLAEALPGAAARGELHLTYQPLVDLGTDTIVGVETLLRWTSPEHGIIKPDEFIPLAEETGAITDIGMWVIGTALSEITLIRQRVPTPPRLFINVAAQQLVPEFGVTARALVESAGMTPADVCFELTESAAPQAGARACLSELRALGFRVAIDDFGAGFSSLSQLAVLPADVLKFDREFLRGIHSPSGRLIVDAVIALAAELGLVTVAEGIETGADASAVRRARCAVGQGYFFSRPVPASALIDLLVTQPLVPEQRSGGLPTTQPATPRP